MGQRCFKEIGEEDEALGRDEKGNHSRRGIRWQLKRKKKQRGGQSANLTTLNGTIICTVKNELYDSITEKLYPVAVLHPDEQSRQLLGRGEEVDEGS